VAENECVKYVANAFDRASTSCLTVGVFAPIAAALYTSASAQLDALQFLGGVSPRLFAAATLHLLGERALGGCNDRITNLRVLCASIQHHCGRMSLLLPLVP
jgi:hypothetical protein